MESISYVRKKRVSKLPRLILAIFSLTIMAFFVSLWGEMESSRGAKKMWNSSVRNFFNTLSLQTVENYAPVLKYGLYATNRDITFSDWETALLFDTLGRKKTTMELVEGLAAARENEDVEEASIMDDTLIIDRALEENTDDTTVGIIYGENYFETFSPVKNEASDLSENKIVLDKLRNSKKLEYLIKNFYIVDSSTSINKSVFDVEKLLKKDCSIVQNSDKPQILIYHTHGASEAFADSDGSKQDSIVGIGSELARILTENYGFNVIHDETCYDKIGGSIDRNQAYNKALTALKKTLDKYPSIEVVIDLHRDASSNKKRVTKIDGKATAQFMFFNGLSRKSSGESISYLKNPRLQGNLAFSLQMKMKAMELYPDVSTKIYLKNLRYNMHMREKLLLIELGTKQNTVEEARNAMEPLAKVLNEVLNQ